MEPRLVEVTEGAARILVHEGERGEAGPGSKDAGPVFYNPAMAVNRDLSSLLVATLAQPEWQVLDGLAASGLRGVRYGVEAGVPLQVEWNDWNPVAVRLAEENAKRNGLEPRVTRRSLAALLHERVWHAVDIDPYGSPAPYLDAATRAVRHGGLLSLTATDATALAGVYPSVCRRRYDALPLHGELGHEAALRILAGAAARHAARHDVAATPLFAQATDHYYRVSLRVQRGAQRADAALAQVGHAFLCPACGRRGFGDERACPRCGGRLRVAGPLWTGPLNDVATVDAMQRVAEERDFPFARWRESRQLLARIVGDARGPGLPYDLHKAAERLGLSSPPMARVLALLEARGHNAWPVHHNRLAIRTGAPIEDLDDAVRQASAEATGAA